MELKGEGLAITCGANATVVKGLPASEFPLIPPIEEGNSWHTAGGELFRALEQVLFAISPTEARPEISGASLNFNGRALTIAGTDSYRLAEKKVALTKGPAQPLSVIVPYRALQDLLRILAQADETQAAEIFASASQLAVVIDGVQFITRLIEGAYPDYRAIVPSGFSAKAVVGRAEFAAALKAAGLFSKTGVYDVGIEVNPKAGSLTVQALNSQIGEHKSVIGGDLQGSDSIKIAFNWKYLLEGLNALRSEKAVLRATDSASPSMLTEENNDDYFYLVMPIKE